jgi:hypothetical protein
MDRIDEALADLRSQEAPNISKTAEKYGVKRLRLSRYWNGISKKKDLAYENQRLLITAQSNTLISYINELTERGFTPSNAIVRNFAATIVKRIPRDYWIIPCVPVSPPYCG